MTDFRVGPPKVCGNCHQQKPCADFYKRSAAPDGLQSWCRACSKAYGGDQAEERVARKLNALPPTEGYSVITPLPPLQRPYQVVCLQAGHVTAELRLTEFQAARIVILGFRNRCQFCGGFLLLEPQLDGLIGGGIQSHPNHRASTWPETAA